MLSPFGEVKATRIHRHKDSGKSRGVGFCCMATKEQCQNAIKILHESYVEGESSTDQNYITVTSQQHHRLKIF